MARLFPKGCRTLRDVTCEIGPDGSLAPSHPRSRGRHRTWTGWGLIVRSTPSPRGRGLPSHGRVRVQPVSPRNSTPGRRQEAGPGYRAAGGVQHLDLGDRPHPGRASRHSAGDGVRSQRGQGRCQSGGSGRQENALRENSLRRGFPKGISARRPLARGACRIPAKSPCEGVFKGGSAENPLRPWFLRKSVLFRPRIQRTASLGSSHARPRSSASGS
jgi:hypothetical protein